jgi:hypothetical protein
MSRFINGLTKGMGSFTLFPTYTRRFSAPGGAWTSVGRAFQAVGDNMRKAMYEQPPRRDSR